MMTSLFRVGWAAVMGGLILAVGPAARAQEQQKAPIPRFSGERVIVVGAPDRYASLAGQIAKLEKASPQSYYVIVVNSSGKGPSATRDYADQVFESWQSQRSRRGPSFDAERSVIIVVALENHQVAVKPGTYLVNRLGLKGERVENDLIPVFIPLARESRYTEAIASLLDATNNWIRARDSETPYVAVKVPATKSAGAGPAPTKTTSIAPATAQASSKIDRVEPAREVASTAPAPVKSASSEWLPVVIVAIPIGLMVMVFVGWIWHLYRRAQGRVAGRIKEIKSNAADVMDRLDGLKERLKLLPTSTEFKQPMTGETQALFTAVNGKLEKLWDGWLHVMDVLEKAQKLADRSGSPLSQKTLAEAEDLMARQGSFAEIEAQAKAIAVDVDRLDQAHEAARTTLEAVTSARPKIDAGLDEIKKLALPTAPYQDELAAVDAGLNQASSVLAADPLGTKTALEQLRSRSDAFLARIDRVASLDGDAKKIKSTLETIRRQVAGHRAQGLKLIEEGGNPDAFLSEAEAAHADTLTSLQAGDPDAATQKLDAAKLKVQEGQATIDKVQKARAFCEKELPARSRETDRLRTALTQAESYQNDLERDFARSSWQAVARNLDQARSLLATFDRQVEQAAAAATTTRQEYVRGAALVEELARQQQIVLRLMSGLGEQVNALVNVRNECRALNEDLAARERQAEVLIRQNESIVSDVARNSLESARRNKVAIIARSGEPAPDWPALRQSMKEIAEDLEIARSQAEEDISAHEALTQEFEQVRTTAGRVYAFLSSHQEDRLAANQHYQAAADALDRVAMELTEPRGRSAALLEQVRGAAADLARSEELAREDIRLAAQARSQISEAGQAISQARGYSSMGMGIDTSASESQVMQAEQLLQGQNYEQSIQLAGASMQTAQRIYYDAMQQALMRQMAVAAEQRRQSVRMAAPAWNGVSFGAAAATAAAAVILDQAATAAPPAPSDTGVGSWSSDTGQGSW
jgi:TPM domain